MKRRLLTIIFLSLSILAAISVSAISGNGRVQALSGSEFKAGRIIDDAIFFNPDSLTVTQIQNFLNSKVPVCDTNGTQPYAGTTRAAYGTSKGYPPPYICLKNYKQDVPVRNPEDGLCNGTAAASQRTAAQIIDIVAKSCGISQKTLIILLEKEQSLVTDDWPWSIQYRSATGYGCPDTAACDSRYYGYFNQVYMAARIYKYYAKYPNSFNHIAGATNYVLYNPNAACGGSNVFIQNQATAGLYNYTPYQPNAAALNNLYGTGNSCSAYGNRNFWRLFRDWFGPTLVDVVRARSDDGNPTQYVIYDGKKQGIPSNDVLEAWGLNRLPLQTYAASTLSNIPNHSTVLSRYMKSTTTNKIYLIDDIGYFESTSAAVRSTWNFPANPGLGSGKLFSILNYKGILSPYFTRSGTSSIYVADKTQTLAFASPLALHAWRKSERIITISDGLYNRYPEGPVVSHNRISVSGTPYAVVDGTRLRIPANMDSTYPFKASQVPVTSALFSYLADSGELRRFVRSNYNGTVYLLNGGVLNGIPSLDIWEMYAGQGSKVASNLGTAPFDLLTKDSLLRTSIVKKLSDNTYYVIDGKARPIPANLEDNYAASSNAFTLDDVHLAAIGVSTSPVTTYITSPENPAVFLLDNGQRRGISNPTTLRQFLKSGETVTGISDYDLANFPKAPNLTNYVSNNGSRYFIDQGSRYPITAAVAADWGLTESHLIPLANGTIDHFTLSPKNMSNYSIINGRNYLISSARYYEALSPFISLWGIDMANQPPLSAYSLFRVKSGGKLDRFAAKDGTIYILDNGSLIGVGSLKALFNAGYTRQPIVPLSDNLFTDLGQNPTVLDGIMVKNGSNTCYILDKGTKRRPNAASQAEWCFGLGSALTLSNAYLALLPNGSALTRSIRSINTNTLYAIDDGTRRWIPSNRIYYTYFAPYSSVSTYLRDLMPVGPPINSNGQ